MRLHRAKRDVDAGSRMHVLDWVQSQQFLPILRSWVQPIGFTVPEDAVRQPKGRHDHRESVLREFVSPEQHAALTGWWLGYKIRAKLPTWDLVVAACDATGCKALVLVEAKAGVEWCRQTMAARAVGAVKAKPRQNSSRHCRSQCGAGGEHTRNAAQSRHELSVFKPHRVCMEACLAWRSDRPDLPRLHWR
jgi:hypothetical protein